MAEDHFRFSVSTSSRLACMPIKPEQAAAFGTRQAPLTTGSGPSPSQGQGSTNVEPESDDRLSARRRRSPLEQQPSSALSQPAVRTDGAICPSVALLIEALSASLLQSESRGRAS